MPVLLCRLGFLLRPLLLFFICTSIISATASLGVRHVIVAAFAAAVVLRVEFFCNIRVAISIEIFVDGLIIFISRTAVSLNDLVFTRGEVFVIERGGEEGTL